MSDSVAEWLRRLDGSGIQQPVDCFCADAQEGRRLGGSDFVAHAAFLLVAGFGSGFGSGLLNLSK